MFGGLGIKLMIAGIIIAVITASIGGFWLYQKSLVDGLRAEIVGLETKVTELIIEKEALKLSNNSLERKIESQVVQNQEIRKELTVIRTIDTASQKKLAEYEKVLRDAARRKKIAGILKSRGASLLLRKMDNNIKCEIEHFEEIDGKCIEGKWLKTGERLVPLTLTPKKSESESLLPNVLELLTPNN